MPDPTSQGVRVHINLRQGALYARPLTLVDDAGDPIDLTGHTFEGHVRASQDADEPLAFAITLSVKDAENGRLDMIFEGADTAGLLAGQTYYFDVFMDGDRPLVHGTIKASQRITHP